MRRRVVALVAMLMLAASATGLAAQDWVSEPARPLRPGTPDAPRAPREAYPPGSWSPAQRGPETLADQVTFELSECLAHGITLIVDCLRNRRSSVMIRRLEACTRSETIPESQDELRACLSAGQW